MIDLVIIISIIFCVILIADIILTFSSIRKEQERFAEAINKMKWERTGRTTLKTNISFLNSELNILLHNEDASEEVICSVDREISMLHRKISLINNTNFVQKVGDNDFQRKTLRCSIMDGELFLDDGAINPVLKKRYLDKALPPCKKCIRDECIVPNVRKDTGLPTTCVVKTIPIDLNEEEENKDDFNITVLKQYFINSNRSVEDSKIATNALYNILDRNKFEYYYVEYRTKTDSIYEMDIFCWFDLGTDRKKFEKLLKNYGFTFIFDDEEDGFWITGVKE